MLQRALNLGEPEGYVRTFVDEAAPMAALLAHVVARALPIAAYATKLLEAFGELKIENEELRSAPASNSQFSILNSQFLVEPLTERELEVLRLIADGHSNQAIAERLVVAVSTVKAHVNHLFGKLAVNSRTQALARAHELHLL